MQQVLSHVVDIAKQAGAEIMRIYATDFKPMTKKDGSMVTIADQTSEKIILPQLAPLIAGIPAVSEESVEAGIIPDIGQGNFWCIDPLDGTRNFVEKNGNFAVNIGLVMNLQPVLGVVYIPASDTLYAGGVGVKGWVEHGGKKRDLTPLHYNATKPISIMIERKKKPNPTQQEYCESIPNAAVEYTESPWRFCELAAGIADICPFFSLSYEWDTAAPHAILRGVGGELLKSGKQPLDYGKNPVFKNPHLVGLKNDLQEIAPNF